MAVLAAKELLPAWKYRASNPFFNFAIATTAGMVGSYLSSFVYFLWQGFSNVIFRRVGPWYAWYDVLWDWTWETKYALIWGLCFGCLQPIVPRIGGSYRIGLTVFGAVSGTIISGIFFIVDFNKDNEFLSRGVNFWAWAPQHSADLIWTAVQFGFYGIVAAWISAAFALFLPWGSSRPARRPSGANDGLRGAVKSAGGPSDGSPSDLGCGPRNEDGQSLGGAVPLGTGGASRQPSMERT